MVKVKYVFTGNGTHYNLNAGHSGCPEFLSVFFAGANCSKTVGVNTTVNDNQPVGTLLSGHMGS